MVIFSCPHMGAFWQVCTLRFTRYKDEEAVLLTSETFLRTKYAASFLQEGVFSNILIGKVKDDIRFCENENDLLKKIIMFYDELFQVNSIDLKSISTFLLWADVENLFSIYLSAKGINHFLAEIHLGQFQLDDRYNVNVRYLNYSKSYENLHRKYYALCGEKGEKIHRILYGSEDVTISDKDEIYNFDRHFFEIGETDRNIILKCFDLNQLNVDNLNIFLLNSAGYTIPLTHLTKEKYYLPYKLIIDYLKEEDIYVKDHPQTHDYGFESAFVENRRLAGIIPIEFFTLIKNFKINNIYSINSTGGDKVNRYAQKVVKLGNCILSEFQSLHKLYAAFSIANLLHTAKTKYHYFCLDKQLLENYNVYMFEQIWKEGELHGINPRILSGDIVAYIGTRAEKFSVELQNALYNASEETKVIFLDKKAIPFAHQKSADEIIKNIVPIRIRKYAVADTVSDLEDEYIYLYCKSASVRMQVKTLYCQRILKNTGIGVSISGKEADNSEHYKVLREYSNSCRIDELFRNFVMIQDELKILIQGIGQVKEYLHLKEQGADECKFKTECIVTEESDKKEGDEEK